MAGGPNLDIKDVVITYFNKLSIIFIVINN